VIVRLAEDEDMQALLMIEETCFGPEKFSPEVIRSFIEREDCFVLIALEEDAAVGSAMCMVSVPRSEGKVASVAVLPDRRKQGIGVALLQVCEEEFRRRNLNRYTLEVDTTNEAAIALYSSSGYEIVDTIQHFYGPGRHAYSMEKLAANT